MNPKKTYMWCYNAASESGKLLAEKLGILRIKHEGSTFSGNETHTVINWGASAKRWGPKGYGFKIINDPRAVGRCSNKLRFFDTVAECSTAPRIPAWTVSPKVALGWLQDGACVLARQRLEGMGGEGIVIMEKPVDLIDAPLYTKYIPKEREFRVYVVGDAMIDFCVKKRKLDETPKNWKIRSRENGFIYCWEDRSVLPDDCVVQALRAIACVGLHFGGVDVIYNEAEKKAYVLEVNTAPWLSEHTAELMAEALQEVYLA